MWSSALGVILHFKLYLSFSFMNYRYFTFLSIYKYDIFYKMISLLYSCWCLQKMLIMCPWSLKSQGLGQGFFHRASPSTHFPWQKWPRTFLEKCHFQVRRSCVRPSAGQCWSLPWPCVRWVNGRARQRFPGKALLVPGQGLLPRPCSMHPGSWAGSDIVHLLCPVSL